MSDVMHVAAKPYTPDAKARNRFLADPYTTLERYHNQFGMRFSVNFFAEPTVVLLGAEAQHALLRLGRNAIRTYPSFQANWLNQPVVHETQVPVTESAHDPNERWLLLQSAIEQGLPTAQEAQTMTLAQLTQKVAFTLIGALLTDAPLPAAKPPFQRLWQIYARGMATPSRAHLPWTKVGHALRAQRQLTKSFAALHAREGVAGAPMVGNMYLSVTALAGYLSWLLVELVQQPNLLQRLCNEVHAEAPDVQLSLEELRQKPLFNAIFAETLRLHPLHQLIPLQSTQDIQVGDMVIATNTVGLLAPGYTQRMAAYFSVPEQFFPDRFLSPREEDKRHPYAYVGFDPLQLVVPERHNVELGLKMYVVRLLRRYHLQFPAGAVPQPMYFPFTQPHDGLRLTLQPRL